MSTNIIAQRSALLLLDFQNIHLARIANSTALITRVATAADAARKHGVLVVHCRIAMTTEESENLPPVFARL